MESEEEVVLYRNGMRRVSPGFNWLAGNVSETAISSSVSPQASDAPKRMNEPLPAVIFT